MSEAVTTESPLTTPYTVEEYSEENTETGNDARFGTPTHRRSELDMCMLPDLQATDMLLRQGDGGTELLELLLQLLGLLLGHVLLEGLGDRLDKLLRLRC